ncbi:MAG TPA: pirin family protein [Povalibacter sp.]|nr:pirin family protein [Povalibacter sp.]
MTRRTLKAQHPARRDDIADLTTRRPLPGPAVPQIDPFLFLNHHGPQVYPPGNRGLPFGPHPHRGFETVTFIIEGSLSHSDSGGHESIIRAGGVQWMTAGRGIVHAELSPAEFLRSGGPLEILQLWVNLPSRLKMTPPKYVGLQKEQIPSFQLDSGRVTVSLIAGEWDTHRGPIDTLWGETMATIACASGGHFSVDVPAAHNIFLYVVRGALTINDQAVREWHLLEFDNQGERLDVTATSDALLLLGHARPIGEPVVAHGPFVMNTREEIQQAVLDYQAGRF